MKRTFDLVVSFSGLALLAPVLLAVAALVKLCDFGPVFFAQERVGRQGRAFKIWKFRTMKHSRAIDGKLLTIGRDPRITRVGHFLRSTKLDELPQLWNVLRGEMSFVGPRPELKKFVDQYTADQAKVLALAPGITDLASFIFFNESEILGSVADPERYYVERLVPEKIRLNLAYAAKANLLLDIVLIAATVVRPLGVRVDLFSWFKIEPGATK